MLGCQVPKIYQIECDQDKQQVNKCVSNPIIVHYVIRNESQQLRLIEWNTLVAPSRLEVSCLHPEKGGVRTSQNEILVQELISVKSFTLKRTNSSLVNHDKHI